MKSNLFYKHLSIVTAVIYCLVSAGAAVYNILMQSAYEIMLSFVSFLFLLLPILLHRILRLKPAYAVHFLLYAFTLLAFVGGMALQGYSKLPYYDKFVHGLSGIVFGIIGILLFYLLKPVKKMEPGDYGLVSWFSLCFSMFIAAVWEIYEYVIGLILGTDPQRVLTSGVADTMLDIIVCLAGALVLEFSIYRYFKQKKHPLLMSLFENFYRINISKEDA